MNVNRRGKLRRGTTSGNESLAKSCFIYLLSRQPGRLPLNVSNIFLPWHAPPVSGILPYCRCSPEKISKPWLPQGGIWIIQYVLLMMGCFMFNNLKPNLEAPSSICSWVKSQGSSAGEKPWYKRLEEIPSQLAAETYILFKGGSEQPGPALPKGFLQSLVWPWLVERERQLADCPIGCHGASPMGSLKGLNCTCVGEKHSHVSARCEAPSVHRLMQVPRVISMSLNYLVKPRETT